MKRGWKYWKASVLLNVLIDAGTAPEQMFTTRDPILSAKIVATMDNVYQRFGRSLFRPAVSDIDQRRAAKAD